MSGAPSGLLVVDKPGGMTSHDVVARVRRLAGTRKVGHAGTLDPMATGVLLLGLERATRLLGHLALTDKRYDATIRLGVATSTDDAEGELLATEPAGHLGEDELRRAAAALTGHIDQVPSAVSAVKVGGRRAHALAREGQTVELAARPITVHQLTVLAVRPGDAVVDLDVCVHCSTGTYVRALARDLGRSLGVGGHLTALRRTAVGPVGVDEATPLADLGRDLPLLPTPEAARRFFATVTLDDECARAVGFGRRLAMVLPDRERPVALLGPDGRMLALYRQRDAEAVPVAVLVE